MNDKTQNDAVASTRSWHIVTGEYTPDVGGVADHTRLLGKALAEAGEEVHIWCGGNRHTTEQTAVRVAVHRIANRFGPLGLLRLGRELDQHPGPRIVLLQYSPNAFGWKGMNLFLPFWFMLRSWTHRDDLRTVFHEVRHSFVRRPLRLNLLALMQRIMVRLIILARPRTYVSTPSWAPMLPKSSKVNRPPVWLPTFSNIPNHPSETEVAKIRGWATGNGRRRIIGHFSSFDHGVTRELLAILDELLSDERPLTILLFGRGSTAFRDEFLRRVPHAIDRVQAVETPSADRVSELLCACDLMLQPYPEGVTARRSTIMACLANGVPTVTTTGIFTESIWQDEHICPLAPAGKAAEFVALVRSILNDDRLSAIGTRGQTAYHRFFSLSQAVRTLLN